MRAARITFVVAGLATCLALAGCYGDLDWREVASGEGRYRITLPAKAQQTTRTLNSAAGAVSMTLQSARAADWLFGVAYTDYPRGSDVQKNIDEQRDALLRNISGRITSEKTGAAGSRELLAEGRNGDAVLMLRARFVTEGTRLYQIAAVGARGGVAETELDTFFSSFKLQN